MNWKTEARNVLRGLLTCERQGGWGKAFWWVRMSSWCLLKTVGEPEYKLAA